MKVLIIGLGSIAKKHISCLREMYKESCKIIALRSSKSAPFLKGVKNIFHIDQLDIEIDFVLISSPTFCHYGDVSSVLHLGKPIFIEKPLSMNLDGLRKLQEKLDEKSIRAYVACNLRFHSCNTFVKEKLQEMVQRDISIEEVSVYCGSFLPNWRSDVDFRTSYSASVDQGGGVHLDLIHELDYLYWFFGSPEKATTYFKSSSSLGVSSVDYAHYVLEYDKFVATVTLNYFRTIAKRGYEIVTSEGVLAVDLLKGEVYFNSHLIFKSESNEISDTYKKQMKYFEINVLENTESHMNSFAEACAVLSLCLGRV